MLDRNGRIAVVLASIVIAVAAFIVLSPGDDETERAGTATATPAATTPAPTAASEDPTAAPTEEPTPEIQTIVVRGGAVEGGVQEIRARQGDQVEFAVRSDAADHVHVHGYDVLKDLTAGRRATLRLKADITGIFEVELEDAGLHVANLRVEP